MYLIRIPKALTTFFPQYQWQVKEHEIALTFDDGPHPESTTELLHILSDANCTSTHFLLGKNAEAYPNLIEQIREQNHAIGHHSYSHLNGWKTSKTEYLDDIKKAYQLFPTALFRPPYGKITSQQWSEISNLYPNMKCCLFNFMPGDFDAKVDSHLLNIRMQNVKGGDVVVIHDRPDCLVKYKPFLKEWILGMKAKGYVFVSLDT